MRARGHVESTTRTVEPTDEQLLASYRDTRRPEVLDELLRRHVPRVRGMVYQMVLNQADADDLTQEVFLRALRGLGQFNGRACFSTWLYRVAMNTAHSFLARRRSRRCEEEVSEASAVE